MKDDLISKSAAIQTAERMYKRCDTSSIEDYHDLLIEALTALPSAQPTLYGYDIKHLAFVASIMAKKGVSPEEAVTAFRDVNRVIEIILEDMKEMQENTLKKLYAVRPAESADVMGDADDKD